MRSGRSWIAGAVLAGLVGGTALVALQKRIDARLDPLREEMAILYLPSGKWLKRLALGYDSLLAGIYWIRAVQHYGSERLAERDSFPLLYPLLDITTTLDPELIVAYRFGAIFLAEPPPIGPGRIDLAVKLLKKGMAARPDYWRFWADLGFIYYWNAKEYAKASRAFLEGSQIPGAGTWMKTMAARVAAEGGDRRTSMFLWWEIHQSTDDPALRRHARERFERLKAEEDMAQLEKLVARYERERRTRPASVRDLIAAGYLGGVPVDPQGFPYQLRADGRVALDPRSPLAQPPRRGKK